MIYFFKPLDNHKAYKAMTCYTIICIEPSITMIMHRNNIVFLAFFVSIKTIAEHNYFQKSLLGRQVMNTTIFVYIYYRHK